MKWPFVHRSTYESVVHHRDIYKEFYELALADLNRQGTNYRALLDLYHALKATGATPAPVPTERAPADPVTTAINAVAGRNHAQRVMMAQAAMEARRNGIADEVIVRQIYDGIPASEGLPA